MLTIRCQLTASIAMSTTIRGKMLLLLNTSGSRATAKISDILETFPPEEAEPHTADQLFTEQVKQQMINNTPFWLASSCLTAAAHHKVADVIRSTSSSSTIATAPSRSSECPLQQTCCLNIKTGGRSRRIPSAVPVDLLGVMLHVQSMA